MTPAVHNRVVKTLRLALSNGPDGEKIACLNRLSAIGAAYDIDLAAMLTNGNAPALDEEAASRIFWEGHARGVAETEQRLRPQRDWTPTDSTSAEVGDDAGRLESILDAATLARDSGILSEWEATFSNDMASRFNRFGNRLYVSEKQWSVLDWMETKFRRAGIL
jgi:hypothetical protein